MEVVVLLGAPGAGKGTVAERLRQTGRFRHLSTGDLLREAVRQGTPVGQEAEAYMKRGDLVPDEVMARLVEERLRAGADSVAYLLDGYPRTLEQAEALDRILQRCRGRLPHVLFFDAPREVLRQRLAGRRVCGTCGAVYHVRNLPPRREGRCDRCGGALEQRPDDREETVERRLEVYQRQTEGLIRRYEMCGLLRRINAAQSLEGMLSDVDRHLGAAGDAGQGAGSCLPRGL